MLWNVQPWNLRLSNALKFIKVLKCTNALKCTVNENRDSKCTKELKYTTFKNSQTDIRASYLPTYWNWLVQESTHNIVNF